MITVGATLGLALLRGFRRVHDEIGRTAEDTRKEFKEVHKEFKEVREDYTAQFREVREAIAENAVAIAGLGGGMRVIENMLKDVFKVDTQKSDQAQTDTTTDTPANTPETQTHTTRDTTTTPAAIAAATGR